MARLLFSFYLIFEKLKNKNCHKNFLWFQYAFGVVLTHHRGPVSAAISTSHSDQGLVSLVKKVLGSRGGHLFFLIISTVGRGGVGGIPFTSSNIN